MQTGLAQGVNRDRRAGVKFTRFGREKAAADVALWKMPRGAVATSAVLALALPAPRAEAAAEPTWRRRLVRGSAHRAYTGETARAVLGISSRGETACDKQARVRAKEGCRELPFRS